jgi:hypothetical protein
MGDRTENAAMVYRGHVRNGKIELDAPADLPEGAAVELSIFPRAAPGDDGETAGSRTQGQPLSIEDEIDRIWADVPESEWDRLPPDLTDQLDHYIYGTPKR